MTKAFFALIFMAVSALSATAQTAWVQVEAMPTLAQGEARAQVWARDFPAVAGYRLASGWYAVVLGPFPVAEARSQLLALRAERLVPNDSFVADGSNFVQQFWPAGLTTLPQPEPVPEPGPVPEVDTAILPEPGAGETAAVPEPEPEPLPPPDETPQEARRAEALLDRAERELIQTALEWEGFYSSGIDGAFGPGTRNAMSDWQQARGYEPTGVLTTRQRGELVGGYRAVLDALGLAPVRDNTAGIEVQMPAAMVKKGEYNPPFAHYPGDGGVRVILISQQGDAATLGGLYEILQTLEIMPLDGPRERSEDSFTIEGTNGTIHSYAQAQLTAAGAVKGFILVWPAGDEKRRGMVLNAMKASFTPIPDAVLPDTAGDGGTQSVDLLSGLEIRRPDVSRTGFYFDASGLVLTTADAVAACERVTIDSETEAQVVARDAQLGIAVLKADVPLAPLGFARFQPAQPRLQSEVAVSGYAYDGRLGAPVLTFGRLAENRGLDGEAHVTRLALNVTPGDAGGPVFDGSGAVVGMLLPPASGDRVLPQDVSFAARAEAIAGFLAGQGLTATPAAAGGDISPEALTRMARDVTVLVSCWN